MTSWRDGGYNHLRGSGDRSFVSHKVCKGSSYCENGDVAAVIRLTIIESSGISFDALDPKRMFEFMTSTGGCRFARW